MGRIPYKFRELMMDLLSPSNKKLRGCISFHILFILELFNKNTNFSASCHVQLWNPIPCGLFYPFSVPLIVIVSVPASLTNNAL
jgi:hypothetical protein